MRKLIIGIVAIVCVDIGFAAYMAADQLADVAAVDAPVILPASKRGLNELRPGIALTETDTDSVATPAASEKPSAIRAETTRFDKAGRPRIESTSYTSKLHFRDVKKGRVVPSPVNFTNTTILYAVYKPIDLKPNKEFTATPSTDRQYVLTDQQVKAASAKVRSKPEHRSFIARMLPIVKTPYKWLKAVGSRLY